MSRLTSGAGKGVLAIIAALLGLTMVGVLSGSAAASGTNAVNQAASSRGHLSAPIVSRTSDGWFRGKFVPQSFSVSGDQMVAHGTVTGLVHPNGQATKKVSQAVDVPVTGVNGASTAGATPAAAAVAPGTCNVLNLVLGPLDLNLLGLEIHLNQVVLNIVANPAGGLLGQLLCAVANLLNGGPLAGLLAQLATLLNQILGQLGLLTA